MEPVTPASSLEYRSIIPTDQEASDFQWFNVCAWDPTARFCVADGALVLDFADYHDPLNRFLTFCGGSDVDSIAAQLLTASSELGVEPFLRLIPESVASKLSPTQFAVQEDPNNRDYVYSTSLTASADRPAYRRFRRTARKIERDFEGRLQFAQLSPVLEFRTQVLAITADWVSARGHDPIALDEYTAISRFFDILEVSGEPQGLVSTGLLCDSELVAFSIDEIISEVLAVGHFGHASRSVPNGSTYLHWKMMSHLESLGVLWLNNGPDLGHDGLRKHKEILQPERFVRKFVVSWA